MKSLYDGLPESPGVYLMKNKMGVVLYVGKAANLKRRVSSYFQKSHEYRIERLTKEIAKIDYKRTDTTTEALILESELIKKHSPLYNIREKDDKSFLYVEITKEKFPRVLLARGKERPNGERFGPFTSASSIREALRIVRRIFPFSVHPSPFKKDKEQAPPRPCFEYEIGLCPGVCANLVSRSAYLKNIRHIKLFFEGKKEKILKSLEREMGVLSKKLRFEEAEKLRRRIFALKHIQDVALIGDSEVPVLSSKSYVLSRNYRIEGYDISNISGASAVGSMVVFTNGKPDKDEYRKFRVRNFSEQNDVGMLKEVLSRRLAHEEWRLPNLILIDGGGGQVNAAKIVLKELGLDIPVVGIAKGPRRKRTDLLGVIPKQTNKAVLVRVRDEAHRFAISYHKSLRGKRFIANSAR